jgi:hypothetical protein
MRQGGGEVNKVDEPGDLDQEPGGGVEHASSRSSAERFEARGFGAAWRVSPQRRHMIALLFSKCVASDDPRLR